MLGGRQFMSSCNRITDDMLLYVGTGCPGAPLRSGARWATCGALISYYYGEAVCAGNAGASTFTIVGTLSRFFFFCWVTRPAVRRPWPAWHGRMRGRRSRRTGTRSGVTTAQAQAAAVSGVW